MELAKSSLTPLSLPTPFYSLLSLFGVVIALGGVLMALFQLAPAPIAERYRIDYLKWLRVAITFALTLALGRVFAAVALLSICLGSIDELSERLHLSVMVQRTLRNFSLLCLFVAFYCPSLAIWLTPALFGLSSSYWMWRMKVSLLSDLGTLLLLSFWVVIPIFGLLMIAALPLGEVKLALYLLIVASASLFGQTALATFDAFAPPSSTYALLEQAHCHRWHRWVALAGHLFGASLILPLCLIFPTLPEKELLGLSLITAVGSWLSHALTHFFLKISTLDDLQLRLAQQMPILNRVCPFLMTHWLAYPYLLYLN